jgi:hypothetical protein
MPRQCNTNFVTQRIVPLSNEIFQAHSFLACTIRADVAATTSFVTIRVKEVSMLLAEGGHGEYGESAF